MHLCVSDVTLLSAALAEAERLGLEEVSCWSPLTRQAWVGDNIALGFVPASVSRGASQKAAPALPSLLWRAPADTELRDRIKTRQAGAPSPKVSLPGFGGRRAEFQ